MINGKSSNFRLECSIQGCQSTPQGGIALHKYPNPARRRKKFDEWCRITGILKAVRDETYIYNNFRICQLHFEAKYITNKKILLSMGIPTLLLPDVPQEPPENARKSPEPLMFLKFLPTSRKDKEEIKITKPDPKPPCKSYSKNNDTKFFNKKQKGVIKTDAFDDVKKDRKKTKIKSYHMDDDWNNEDSYIGMSVGQEEEESNISTITKDIVYDSVSDTIEEGEVLNIPSIQALDSDEIKTEDCEDPEHFEDIDSLQGPITAEEILKNAESLEKAIAFKLCEEKLNDLLRFMNNCKEDDFTIQQIACMDYNVTAVLDFAKSNYKYDENSNNSSISNIK